MLETVMVRYRVSYKVRVKVRLQSVLAVIEVPITLLRIRHAILHDYPFLDLSGPQKCNG